MSLQLPELPIVPFLPGIAAALARHKRLVLQAEPGAGKTTVVPPYLLQAGFLAGKTLVMLEPRRLATAAAAARIAELLGEPLGRTAGYAVRLERRTSRETRIECVTEGLFVRRLQTDPELKHTGLVILDEFHERSLHADLALALTLDACELNPHLHLLVMSATLDAEQVGQFLGAPVMAVPGKVFPVETLYLPPYLQPEQGLLTSLRRPSGPADPAVFNPTAFVQALRQAVARSTGDILAFLPGAREIRAVKAELTTSHLNCEVHILHGMISLEEQRQVISPQPANRTDLRRRIILATNVAETSLTVPGVRAVVDAGLARQSHFHIASGMNRLMTERISVQSATQRCGRAARLGPGLCIRVWDMKEKLQPYTPPEISRSELSGLVLEAALWGVKNPADLRLLTPPPPAMWKAGQELLFALGALDESGRPTGRGRAMAGLGLETRLAALVVAGQERGEPVLSLAVGCAALLADRDPSPLQDEADFTLRLEELAAVINAAADTALTRRYSRAVREYTHLLTQAGLKAPERVYITFPVAQAGSLLLAVFPDRLAVRVETGRFQLAGGRVLRLKGRLADAPFVVVLEAEAGSSSGSVYLAVPVSLMEIQKTLAHLITNREELEWNQLKYKARKVSSLDRITLTEQIVQQPSPERVVASFCEQLRNKDLLLLPWSQASEAFLQRVRYTQRTGCLAGLPDFSEKELLATLEDWLVPFLNVSEKQVLDGPRLLTALQAHIPYALKRPFEDQAPENFKTPAGTRHRIQYDEADAYVEVRIQEQFGLTASPLVCGRPLVFRLLSPASRPLQITRDLAGFWKNTYPEIRSQMKIRYPKHYWPEDPLTAQPTHRTRPR